MSHYYRNNTHLNLADIHTAQKAGNFIDLARRPFNDEEAEYNILRERAVAYTELSQKLRDRNLELIYAALDQQHTRTLKINNVQELKDHLKLYDNDEFEKHCGVWLKDDRIHIVNYTYSLVKAMVEFNHTSPIALKLIKRFAIRLGLSQYTGHI